MFIVPCDHNLEVKSISSTRKYEDTYRKRLEDSWTAPPWSLKSIIQWLGNILKRRRTRSWWISIHIRDNQTAMKCLFMCPSLVQAHHKYFSISLMWYKKVSNVRTFLQGPRSTKFTITSYFEMPSKFPSIIFMNVEQKNSDYKLVIRDLISHFFPPKALQCQKRYIRRVLYKPCEANIRKLICRINKIIN